MTGLSLARKLNILKIPLVFMFDSNHHFSFNTLYLKFKREPQTTAFTNSLLTFYLRFASK